MIALQLVFSAGFALCMLLTFANGYWEAYLRIPERDATYIINLPRASTWNPPPLPAYRAFLRDFHDLPKEHPMGAIIKRVPKWEWTLTDGSLYLDEAEELYLDESLPEFFRLCGSPMSNAELEQHPLTQLLLKRGMKGLEDSLP
jgi:hypothetical protein